MVKIPENVASLGYAVSVRYAEFTPAGRKAMVESLAVGATIEVDEVNNVTACFPNGKRRWISVVKGGAGARLTFFGNDQVDNRGTSLRDAIASAAW